MRIRFENAGNITSASIESAGITVLGGRNIEGRNTLLKAAYAAARANELKLLEDGVGRFSRQTGPDHARGHAELNRCAPSITIREGGSVHVTVHSGEDASTGRPVHLGVDRIALTRQKWAYDPRASGTTQDLDRLLRKHPETDPPRRREWAAKWLAEITGVRIKRTREGDRTGLAWHRPADGARGDEYGLDTAAAALAALAIWTTAYTGLVAMELPEAGLTHAQALETARLLAALGADGCDVWISTDSEIVLEELGAIATDGHTRRRGARNEKLPLPDQIRAWRIDGAPGEPGPAVRNIWNDETGTWAMGSHATWTRTHNRWANAWSRKNDGNDRNDHAGD